ncbi:exodeoxyribonuclease V subunit gamma [Microaerobacter geothermalis]|uniref:PD-(D/E)XK nuclease family protein n=1 Tax=Microaerobacter geothermalis TaxID=674972 RepID=UPI001F1E3554|nr:PD-(D/E)XK nuclease family protein [Microaerobacter geothermalis]MCF6094726.1 exodeoxyribonuclease V subunit gamma [Microaerobacter geothermalis]
MRVVYTGPFGQGKRQEWIKEAKEMIRKGQGDAFLFLLPTRHLLKKVREELLADTPGVVDLKLVTFDEIADRLIREHKIRTIHLEKYGRMKLVEQILEEEKQDDRLNLFHSIPVSQGLLESLVHSIGELKRAGITQEEAEVMADDPHRNPKERGLLVLYLHYQKKLKRDGFTLMDPEEKLVVATKLLQEMVSSGETFFLQHVNTLWVDHFTDFTPLQYALLLQLLKIKRIQRAEIYLPYQPSFYEEIPHLHEIMKQTLMNLEQEGFVHAAYDGENHRVHHELRRFREALLRQDLNEPLPAPEQIQLLPASSIKKEIEMVGKEIKRILTKEKDLSPSGIAVIVRNQPSYLPLIQEIFSKEGIPVQIPELTSVAETPLFRQFISFLRIASSNWHKSQLIKAGEGVYLNWSEAEPPPGLENWIKQMGIVDGKETWFRRIEWSRSFLQESLDRMGNQSLHGEEEDDYFPEEKERKKESILKRIKWLDRLEEWLNQIKQMIEQIPVKGTIQQYIQVLNEVMNQVSLKDAPFRLMNRKEYTWHQLNRDQDVIRVLDSSLQQMKQISLILGDDNILSFPVFLEQWVSVLHGEMVTIAKGEPQGVHILDPSGARGDDFHTVFVLGMNEGSFPLIHRENWLMGDAERLVFQQKGKILPASHYHNEMERLFFLMTVSLPKERIIFSFVSPKADEKVLQSSFVDWMKENVEPGDWAQPVIFSEARKTRFFPEDKRDISNQQELRRWLAQHMAYSASYGEDSVKKLISQEKVFWQHVIQGIHVERNRWSGPFGPWDGRLTDPRIHQEIQKIFSADRPYSITFINEYAASPLTFFFSRVLGVKPVDEMRQEITPVEKGNLLHEVLRQVYEAERGKPFSQLQESVLAEKLIHVFERECEVFSNHPLFVNSYIWNLEKERLKQEMLRWLKHELAHEKNHDFKPSHFEFSFGLPVIEGQKTDPESIPHPVKLKLGDTSLRLYGKVDRIDIHDDGSFVIYDYKLQLGRRYKGYKDVEEGRNFQLPLYLAAVQTWLKETKKINAQPIGAGFYSLNGKEKFKKLGMWLEERKEDAGISSRTRSGVIENLEDAMEDALQTVGVLFHKLRRGEFHMLPEHTPATYYADQAVYRMDPVQLERRVKFLEKRGEKRDEAHYSNDS